MILSWKFYNRFLWGISAMVLVLGFLIPFVTTSNVESNEDHVDGSALRAMLSSSRPVANQQVSDDEIERALRVNLHRMNPPIAVPPEVNKPPAPKPPPPPTVLFSGKLLGTIQDNQPEFCYAIIQWPDNKIRLIAKNSPISDQEDDCTVQEITANSITLKKGELTQVLELGSQQ